MSKAEKFNGGEIDDETTMITDTGKKGLDNALSRRHKNTRTQEHNCTRKSQACQNALARSWSGSTRKGRRRGESPDSSPARFDTLTVQPGGGSVKKSAVTSDFGTYHLHI